MTPERDRYQAVLESLADGADVDWAALESSAVTSKDRQRYKNLRLVARVAELHRTLTLDEDDVVAPVARERDFPSALSSPWGHLHLGERIASGAYGEIYVAHDSRLNRNVALKILRRGAAGGGHSLDQLLVEARTLAKVRHENVVTIHGAEVRDGRVGLWMDLIHGQTLEAWLQSHGTMGAGEVSALGVAVCRAVAAVHSAGLVHADIKAQNVMRENGGRLVLMDFGAGRAQGAAAANVAGTPMYLAPEVLAGGPPTPRSDIYSVGVLLFHLLTGAYPCTADDLDALRAAHANASRVWLRDVRPDLPDSLIAGIERALAPDPAQRFTSAGEMENALAGVSQQPAPPPPIPLPARLVGFATAAAAFLAVVAALIVWSRVTESKKGIVLSEVRSIGILPMRDLTDSAVPEHFVDGLTDELIATLGQVSGLTIKPAPRPDSGDMQSLARALNVDALLDTTLSRGDNESGPPHLRVRAKLIAAASQSLLWSSPAYDRPRGATLELPGLLASSIATAVHAPVSPAQASRMSTRRQTDPAAEDAYLQGVAHLDQYGGGDAEAARDAFKRALERDQNDPRAHAGLAQAYLQLGVSGDKTLTEAGTDALAEINQALAIDQESPEAHALLGYLRFNYHWDWSDAEREYLRSLNSNPNYVFARVMYADTLAGLHRFDEAVSQAKTAKDLAPGSGAAARRYAVILYYKRDLDGADRALDEAERIDPSNAGLPLLRARFAETRGRFEEALRTTTIALERAGGRSRSLRVQQLQQEALAGHREEALAGLRALEAEDAAHGRRVAPRDRAYIYLALGDRQRALELLSQAVDERDSRVIWLGVDPRLDALRGDPRFQRLLKVVGLPVQP